MKIFFYWINIPVAGTILYRTQKTIQSFFLFTNNISVSMKYNFLFTTNPVELSLNEINTTYKSLARDYDYFFIPGWRNIGLLKLSYFAKKNHKKVILLSDNIINNSLKQRLGRILFLLLKDYFFDLAMVPGIQSKKLMKEFGFQNHQIYFGFYGANEFLYKCHIDITKRENEFLYVGQLIRRKNIKLLIKSFKKYLSQGGTWKLRIVGDGYLKSYVNKHLCNQIIYEGPLEPNDVALTMNKAKVLVLLSKVDHWATVVAEAAASGMGLILSDGVGSHSDLLTSNGFLVDIKNQNSIVAAMVLFNNLSDKELDIISKKSMQNSIEFNSQNTLNTILDITK